MEILSHNQIVVMFLALGMLLGAARLLGEIAQRLRQPAILGELLAGILLGPTILGNAAPPIHAYLFPAEGPNAIALGAIATLAGVLFLLVAGIKVDLSVARRRGNIAHKVSLAGIFVAIASGLAAATLFPEAVGREEGADPLVFALFFATALLISALPVVAKTLMDLDLYRTDLGMIVISAAIVEDLVGWIIFAVILGLAAGEPAGPGAIAWTVLLTLGFAGAMLTVGRTLIHKAWPLAQAYTRWPGGVLGFAVVLGLFGAAAAEQIGIHAIFGSFLAGVAIGDSPHLRERTRVTIEHFVSFIFAPVFFATIGLRVDFLAHFDLLLVLLVFVIACFAKVAGGALGARWGGLPPREAWAVGFAVNSRGEMEIILGLLALEAGIIGQDLFVALVVMAIATSMMSGPMMRLVLRRPQPRSLPDLLSARLFIPSLDAATPREAIGRLAKVAGIGTGLDASLIEAAAWAREEAMGTGIGNGVAMPHARLSELRAPVVVAAISPAGVDFDAPDDKLARLIFLVLTPEVDAGAQLEIASDIARLFRNARLRAAAIRCDCFTEFLGAIKSEDGDGGAH